MPKAVRKASTSLIVTSACLLWAAGAAAQALSLPNQRPTRGVFGRAPKGEGLDVTAAFFSGYDDDQAEHGAANPGDLPRANGQFSGLDVGLLFSKQTRNWSFGANGHTGARYYPEFDGLMQQHSVAGGFAGQVGKGQLSFIQSVGYSPFYNLSTLPMVFNAQPTDAPSTADQTLVQRPTLSLMSSGAFSQKFGRTELSVTGSSQRTEYTEEQETGLRADALYGRLQYHLNRDVALVGGYGLQRGQYAIDPHTTQTFDVRNMEFGIDYNHPISLSRKTTVGFATGAAAVGNTDGTNGYRMVGDARISREFGRTWLATGSYRRGVGLIPGFGQPIFSDGAAVSVAGDVTPRVTLSFNGGYAAGELVATRVSNRNTTLSTSMRMQYALTRMLALSGDLSYGHYSFDSVVGLPMGIEQQFDRRSARIGLSLWLPLFR
jgi:hypothetical protein